MKQVSGSEIGIKLRNHMAISRKGLQNAHGCCHAGGKGCGSRTVLQCTEHVLQSLARWIVFTNILVSSWVAAVSSSLECCREVNWRHDSSCESIYAMIGMNGERLNVHRSFSFFLNSSLHHPFAIGVQL